MKALIAGGGIGGLATAVALQRVGIDSLVLERAPEIHAVGAALSLWPNAMRALRQLGLERMVSEKGAPIHQPRTLDQRGRLLSVTNLEPIHQAAGAPSVCIQRSVLQKLLLCSLERHGWRTNSAIRRFEQHDSGVTVFLADGSSHTGDLLIGADGVNSVVRAGLWGSGQPRYAGYTCWRGLARIPESLLPKGETLLALGRGSQIGMSWCGPEQVYWFATRNLPRHTPDGTHGRKADVIANFKDWCRPIPEILQATNEQAILKNDIVDRPSIPAWTKRRVTLLGDAAHPSTPNLGQGACMALEDAVVLADRLRHAADIGLALQEYESLRHARTTGIVLHSRRVGSLLQMENRAAIWARNRLLASNYAQKTSTSLIQRISTHPLPDLTQTRQAAGA